jgi:hypothetical protein
MCRLVIIPLPFALALLGLVLKTEFLIKLNKNILLLASKKCFLSPHGHEREEDEEFKSKKT